MTPLLLHASAPDDTPIVSVLVGRRYAYRRDGSCSDLGDFSFSLEPELYQGIDYPGRTRPAQLRRDFEGWGWKDGTDLVIQGTVRRERPTRELSVELACRGPTCFTQRILVTGDRRVERHPSDLRLSDPVPFREMPMRWDKAYGGTDERAEDALLGSEHRALLREQMEPEAMARWSECSYPRNPAGKGFLLDEAGADGLSWPNLEFPDDRLSLERLCAPMDRWGSRPYPACWDFLPYHWFPRCIMLFDPLPTHDGKMPEPEVTLGLVPPDLFGLAPARRPWPLLGRVAHPFLQRHRLQGAEEILVTAMGPEGENVVIDLPGERPIAHLHLDGARHEHKLPPVLDLVFVETEIRRVTVIWRCTLTPAPRAMRPDWQERSRVRIAWQ
jgi:hypothetical protein